MFPNENTVKALRAKFPVGCRVVLDQMDDVQAPPIGTQGTCRGVDDAGSVMVAWDSGGSLSVAYGADSCHRVASEEEIKVSLDHIGKTRHRGAFCPRCGTRVDKEYGHQLQAVSRVADILICNTCGTSEAMEAFRGNQTPLADWAIVKAGWVE